MKKRIWELDAFRGLCILGVVVVHLVYDLVELYGLLDWKYPAWFSLIKEWGGIVFLLISGISVTLGSRSVRRGLIVFGCGMICTAVTYGMYLLNMSGKGIIIWFGVLHCLGCCMLLWSLFRKCPLWLVAAVGLVLAVVGLYFDLNHIRGEYVWLVPFGIPHHGFSSSDYFPLLPHLGFFLLGACLGKTVYRRKESLMPRVNAQILPLRFLCGCGKYSLFIYLLHQPVISGVLMLITWLK